MVSTNFTCTPGNGDPRDALEFRVGGLFGILVVSLIGFLLPAYFSEKKALNFIYYLFQSFASGVVIATGLVHVLPDAMTVSQNRCLGLSQTFPWVFVITLHATIFTFMGEHILKRWMSHVWRKTHKLAITETPTGDKDSLVLAEKGGMTKIEMEEGLHLQNLRVVAYTLEAGVIFHSIFVGLTLGTSRDISFVKGLTFALLFHQGFEGIALGAAIAKAKIGWLKTLLFGLVFAFVTPIGVAMGILIGNSYNENDKEYLAAELAFNSVSAGILIYNGIVDIIVPTFEDEESEALKGPVQTGLGFFLMLCGSGLMSFVAKWA